MGKSKIILVVLKVIHGLLEIWKKNRTQERVDAVRSDPGGEWLRKFGGTDERGVRENKPAAGTDDSGRQSG